MRKELKDGKMETLKGFYGRLYGEYKLFTSLKKTLNADKSDGVRNGRDHSLQKNIQTFIIGQNPNIKSFREFVSLDTRSREIRHRQVEGGKWKVESGKPIINLIIRKYMSSGGVEYFVSFEDELGYIYGFTRLLLPKPEETIQIK